MMKNPSMSHGTARVASPFKRVAASLAFATALGFSASASAEMLRYEFVQAQGASDLLSGYFNYNHSDDTFGDADIALDGGNAGTYTQVGSLNGVFNVGGLDFWNINIVGADPGARGVVVIAAGDLGADTPIVGPIGTFRWEATLFGDINAELVPSGVFENLASIRTGDASNTFVSAFAVSAVPEPATYAMMAIGLLGIAGMRRRQNKA